MITLTTDHIHPLVESRLDPPHVVAFRNELKGLPGGSLRKNIYIRLVTVAQAIYITVSNNIS